MSSPLLLFVILYVNTAVIKFVADRDMNRTEFPAQNCIPHPVSTQMNQEITSRSCWQSSFFADASLNSLIYALSVSVGIALSFYLLYKLIKPINWIKDLTDVGFSQPRGCSYSASHARRTRKTGTALPPPFPNGWFALMESQDLPPGEVRSINCLGENFAVMRTENGEAAILDAYCPHLGANMAIGGVVRDNCLECPFHQWRFSSDTGLCTGVPYSSKGTVPKAAVRKWPCRETSGSIFVWHHSNPDQTPWELPVVPEIDSGSWIYRGRNEFYINCHIQEIPENGADVAHLNSVHAANLFAGSDPSHHGWRLGVLADLCGHMVHTWNASWEPRPDADARPHCAAMRLQHALGLRGTKIRVCEMDVTAEQIGPGYVQLNISTSLGRMVIIQTVTPLEPLLQKVVHRIYCPWYLIPYASFVMLGECIMFERDILIWNHKKYMSSPHLLREDKSVKRYRTWYQQFYSEQSKTFQEATQTLEW